MALVPPVDDDLDGGDAAIDHIYELGVTFVHFIDDLHHLKGVDIHFISLDLVLHHEIIDVNASWLVHRMLYKGAMSIIHVLIVVLRHVKVRTRIYYLLLLLLLQ